MALINNNYIFVEEENVSRETESTSHPIETGGEMTDHVQTQARVIDISGKIGSHDGRTASDIMSAIEKLQNTGSLITYVGRNVENNMQIQSFNTGHPNTVWGGCTFDMQLKEVKIAKKAYVEQTSKSTGTQQVENGTNKNVYHTVKKGDTVWSLVTKNYKTLEPKYSKTMDKCNWIMQQNPDAFSKKGDFGTLQIGKKLLVGYRK